MRIVIAHVACCGQFPLCCLFFWGIFLLTAALATTWTIIYTSSTGLDLRYVVLLPSDDRWGCTCTLAMSQPTATIHNLRRGIGDVFVAPISSRFRYRQSGGDMWIIFRRFCYTTGGGAIKCSNIACHDDSLLQNSVCRACAPMAWDLALRLTDFITNYTVYLDVGSNFMVMSSSRC